MEIQFNKLLCRVTLSPDGIRRIIKSWRELNSNSILKACLKDSNKVWLAKTAVTAINSLRGTNDVTIPLSCSITQQFSLWLSHSPTVLSSLKEMNPETLILNPTAACLKCKAHLIFA